MILEFPLTQIFFSSRTKVETKLDFLKKMYRKKIQKDSKHFQIQISPFSFVPFKITKQLNFVYSISAFNFQHCSTDRVQPMLFFLPF